MTGATAGDAPRLEAQLKVQVADLRRNLGSRLPVQRSAVLDDISVVDSGLPPGGIIEVDLVLDAVSDGVVASGTVSLPWLGACRRCLDEIEGRATHQVQEAFTLDGDGDTYILDGDELDLEPLVRDAATLGLPLAPLCEEACRGPDPERFPARPAREPAQSGDPRWAVLDGLSFDDESSE